MIKRLIPGWVAATAAALLLGLLGAGAALADSSDSSNWAGYAIHRSGVNFRYVVGSWTQPHATCTSGRSTYSSVWVGIGGYSATSPALEQVGTELDCTASGRAVSSSWYELVPAPSRDAKLTVHQGDRMQASVYVTGHQVTLALNDLTRNRSFTKRVKATLLDTTSAEWIVEAPSECTSATNCRTLPLADFGRAAITGAKTTTTAGHHGSIADAEWTTSKISLAVGGPWVTNGGGIDVLATPSVLSQRNSAFTVTYTSSGFSDDAVARQGSVSSRPRLVHPMR